MVQNIFRSQPALSFILITFAITFSFWFAPVLLELPRDIAFGFLILGGSGPLLAGYILTLVNSGARVAIGSKRIFSLILLGAGLVLYLRLLFNQQLSPDPNTLIPGMEAISIPGFLLLAIGIVILALNVSNATNGRLKENYISSFIFERPKWKWYLLALLFFPVLAMLSYWLADVFDAARSEPFFNPDPLVILGFFSTLFFFGGNEEFGWRGYLQKELQKRMAPLWTALIISFLWSLWHLPLHYNGFYSYGGFMDLLPRFFWTIPLTILFTWLYNSSRYSILAVVILHACFNNFSKAFGISFNLVLILALVVSVFCIVSGRMWKKKPYPLLLSKNPGQ